MRGKGKTVEDDFHQKFVIGSLIVKSQPQEKTRKSSNNEQFESLSFFHTRVTIPISE